MARKHLFGCWRGEEGEGGLFSTITKSEMSGLGMAPKENFFAYSTQFIFMIIRLVPGNVVMVAIDMCRKSPITGEWIYGIRENMYYLYLLCFLFIYLVVCLILFLHFYTCNV